VPVLLSDQRKIPKYYNSLLIHWSAGPRACNSLSDLVTDWNDLVSNHLRNIWRLFDSLSYQSKERWLYKAPCSSY